MLMHSLLLQGLYLLLLLALCLLLLTHASHLAAKGVMLLRLREEHGVGCHRLSHPPA